VIEKADLSELPGRIWLSLKWYGAQLVHEFVDHDCPTRAAALTYTTLFAVVPMMTVAYAMLSVLPVYDGAGERIEAFIFDNVLPSGAAAIHEYLAEFSRRARSLSLIGFAFLFVTTFMLLVTIEGTFNTIWQVAERRKGLQRLLVYWGVMSLGPPMIVAGILISVYLTSLPMLTDLDVFGVGQVLLGYLPRILTCLGFTVLYKAMPNTPVRISHALAGGLLIMFLLEGAKALFNAVIARSSFTSIYGAFAAVPFFLFWMYMVWVLILSGAIFVRTLGLKPELGLEPSEPLLVKCARVLELLYRAHLVGDGLTDEEIDAVVPLTADEKERVLRALLELKAMRQVGEGWMLGRSLKGLTLWDLYQLVPEGIDLDGLSRVQGMEHVVEPLKALLKFGSNQMSISLDTVFGGVS
jgi:membrane protein